MCKHTLKKENPLAPVSFSALLQKAEFLKGGLFLLSSFPFHSFFCSAIQLRLSLCEHMDCCPPVSSVHGISQARILEWVVISSSRGSSRPRDWTDVSCISCIGRQIFYRWGPGEAILSWTHSKTYLAATCPPHCWIQWSVLLSSLALAAASQILRWWSSPPWSTLTWPLGLDPCPSGLHFRSPLLFPPHFRLLTLPWPHPVLRLYKHHRYAVESPFTSTVWWVLKKNVHVLVTTTTVKLESFPFSKKSPCLFTVNPHHNLRPGQPHVCFVNVH